MPRQNYVVVGLGLIGGSLAATISKRIPSAHVIGVSRSPQKIRFAKEKKFIDEGATNLKSAVKSADYIFVCTPVDTIPKIVSEIDRNAKVGAIVTDTGSTKSEIIKAIERKKLRHARFVGSHPLAGSHLTGVDHAIPDLFKGAVVFVTPSGKSQISAVRKISLFWRKLKTRVKIVTPEIHDQIVSEISHLPHAAAALLTHAASTRSLAFAASGFLDTTRVAQGDPRLWTPILMTNRRNLVKRLKRLSESLTRVAQWLSRADEKAIHQFLQSASVKRSKLS